MTNHKQHELSSLLAGIQLGVFEVIWPTFRWINRILVKKDDRIHFFIEATNSPDNKAWDDLQRLLAELIDIGARYHEATLKSGHTVQYGPQVPRGEGYIELMSDQLFKEVATKHAPWRLDAGR